MTISANAFSMEMAVQQVPNAPARRGSASSERHLPAEPAGFVAGCRTCRTSDATSRLTGRRKSSGDPGPGRRGHTRGSSRALSAVSRYMPATGIPAPNAASAPALSTRRSRVQPPQARTSHRFSASISSTHTECAIG